MPVDSHSHSGVCAPSQGSRITARGISSGWRKRFLDLGLLVGDTRRGREVAAGNRGRHADLAHRRRGELRRSAATGPDPVDVIGMADIVGEAKLHRLGAVGDRTAADGNNDVGVGGACLVRRGNDGRARRMRRHRIEGAGAARPQHAANVLDFIGFAVQRAADHQEGAFHAQPVQLLDNRLGCRPPEHDLIHRAEYDTTFMHGCPPRTFLTLVAGLWRQG